jgi:diguanylate cyclase (GGDEF)-like protein
MLSKPAGDQTGLVSAAPSRRPLVFAALGLLFTLAVMSTGIVLTHHRSRNQIVTNLQTRGTSSAGFISTSLAQQARLRANVLVPEHRGRAALGTNRSTSASLLPIFVGQTIALKMHHVFLADAHGNVIASSPIVAPSTLAAAVPALAHALTRSSHGEAKIAGRLNTFVSDPVAGTPWKLVIAVPNSELFASIGGWALWLPWIVFSLVAMLGVAVLTLLARSYSERTRLAILSTELAQAARTDTVTGLANRRALQERMAQASAYAHRYGESLAVLMIDLDRFKHVNDTYGHRTGDEVLRAVAECMRTVFRESDVFGRWGGDEFVAVLPSTDRDGARGAGQRLCESVAAVDVGLYGLSEQLSLSVGCASGIRIAPDDLIAEADDFLFLAKRAGRSRVIVGR